jgi:hypothetical protein
MLYHFNKIRLCHSIKLFRRLAALIVVLSFVFSPSLLLAVKTELSSSEDTRKSNLRPHPVVNGSLSSFYAKAIRTWESNGDIQDTSVGGNDGMNVIQEISWDKSSALAVVKRSKKEKRGEKEPLIYALSREAGLSCIIPSFTYKGFAIEVLAKFLPNTAAVIPNDIRSFYNNFRNDYGVITLKNLLDKIQSWNRTDTKQVIDKYLDKQSLQELCLARDLFCLGDMYARNILLCWTNGKIGFYAFDTGGHDDWGTVIADSMGASPNGSDIIDLCLDDSLTAKSRSIIAGWSQLKKIPTLRTRIERLWSVPHGERIGPLLGRESAYDRWINRMYLLQSFAALNPSATMAELDLAFVGIWYKSPDGAEQDLSTAFNSSGIIEGAHSARFLTVALKGSSYSLNSKPCGGWPATSTTDEAEVIEYLTAVDDFKRIANSTFYSFNGGQKYSRTDRVRAIISYCEKYPYSNAEPLIILEKFFSPSQWKAATLDWFVAPILGEPSIDCLPNRFPAFDYMSTNPSIVGNFTGLPLAIQTFALESHCLVEGCRMDYIVPLVMRPLTLPAKSLSLALFWLQNPGVREWALT